MTTFVSGATKIKDMKMSKVTTEQVSQWVGNGFDGSREEAFIEIITEVANGEYDIEELNSDIRSYGR